MFGDRAADDALVPARRWLDDGGRGPVVRFLRRRWVAVVATVLLMAGFLLASFVIAPLITHSVGWRYPPDIWDTYQLAKNITVGDYANIYGESSLVASPAILLVFLPIQQLTQHFGLTTGFGFPVSRPSAWPIVAPVSVLLCAPALFGADSIAQAIGAGWRRRVAIGACGAIALGNVLWWGHPEDALAVAFLLFAMRSALGKRWALCAWLLGVGFALQPLIGLAIPVVILCAGWRRLPSLVVRILAPAATLLLVPFASDWPDTYRAVVVQPVFPNLVRPTVWLRFAPHIANETWMGGRSVAGGPTRLISVAIAIGVGVWFMRKERPPQMLVWCAALVLALRFLFEAGVAPYYVWPPLAVVLVSGAIQPWKRMSLTCVCALGVTWVANVRIHTEWIWWPICAGLVLALVFAFPAKTRERARDPIASFTELKRDTLERV
jgi:hypothetical protein